MHDPAVVKQLKMEKQVMQQEIHRQAQLIDKLSNKVDKLKLDQGNKQQIIDLQLEVKKLEYKLRKRGEKREQEKKQLQLALGKEN